MLTGLQNKQWILVVKIQQIIQKIFMTLRVSFFLVLVNNPIMSTLQMPPWRQLDRSTDHATLIKYRIHGQVKIAQHTDRL